MDEIESGFRFLNGQLAEVVQLDRHGGSVRVGFKAKLHGRFFGPFELDASIRHDVAHARGRGCTGDHETPFDRLMRHRRPARVGEPEAPQLVGRRRKSLRRHLLPS
jgi:hypothetical protein